MKKALCILGMVVAGVGSMSLLTFESIPAYGVTNPSSSTPSSSSTSSSSSSSSSSSTSNCEHSILGLRPWYSGLKMKGNSCALESPTEAEMPTFVWRIVLNVLADASVIAGYLAIGFVIYGGIQYIMSAGDPGKVARGKKMLSSAAIGLVIAILATVIVNIIIALLSEAAA